MSEFKRPTIHYTRLDDLPPDHVLHQEWNAYRRELPRLLEEGKEGKFVLLKGGQVIDFFDTHCEAVAAGNQRFGVYAPFMVHQVREEEPLLRVPRFDA
jgi:hypothetical protein